MKPTKIISLVFAVIVVLNIALFAFGKVNVLLFWLVIVLAALYVYFILPNIKKW